MEKIKINIIKTDKNICFISDCMTTSGYDFDYHCSKIDNFLFNGEKPKSTNYKNWLKLKNYPTLVQSNKDGETVNKRYELTDKSMVSDKLPLVITIEERDSVDEKILKCFYEYKFDKLPNALEDVDCEFILLCEVVNYEEAPIFDYKAMGRDEKYLVTNKNIEHSLVNKLFMPTPILSTAPCRLSSKEFYDIVRQYIKENIDLKVSKITSDYDFCFEVKKIIPRIDPEIITYQNFFAKTKKERAKTKFVISKYDEKSIFQMTHTQENYRGYTPIQSLEANNEWELKEKLDNFLTDLMININKPLIKCPYCNSGYIEEIANNIKEIK